MKFSGRHFPEGVIVTTTIPTIEILYAGFEFVTEPAKAAQWDITNKALNLIITVYELIKLKKNGA